MTRITTHSKNIDAPTLGVSGGTGTLIVLVASNNWEPGTFWHDFLLYASPTLTLLAGVIWAATILYLKSMVKQRTINRSINEIKILLSEAINDQNVSEEYKGLLKSALDELQKVKVANIAEKAEILDGPLQKLLQGAEVDRPTAKASPTPQ